jgi:hypothetical protein
MALMYARPTATRRSAGAIRRAARAITAGSPPVRGREQAVVAREELVRIISECIQKKSELRDRAATGTRRERAQLRPRRAREAPSKQPILGAFRREQTLRRAAGRNIATLARARASHRRFGARGHVICEGAHAASEPKFFVK